MKINFQSNDVIDTGNHNVENSQGKNNSVKKSGNAKYGESAFQVDFMGENGMMWNVANSSGKDKGKSLIDIQQEAGNVDVAVQQDYMTLMSNTMSEEDYAKLEEEGFHFQDMDPDAAVSIVDKIKAELAKSGQVTAGYNDDLDMDTLAAAVGSDTLARAVADSFTKANVPFTRDNLSQVKKAWDMASNLKTPDDGTVSYMIDNELEPEIWNFYLAENSGSSNAKSGAAGFYAENVQGYYSRNAEGDISGIQGQIDKLIIQAGFEVSDESRESAEWLLKKNLPITAETLVNLKNIKECEFPVTEGRFASAVADAIIEGKNPIRAELSGKQNIYDKAVQILSHFMSDDIIKDIGENISARRQLEEIRFRMTAEVNVRLLKSNFSIDTAPMEQLVEALKQAESEVAGKYFPNDSDAVLKYELMNEANRIVSDLPTIPASIVGNISMRSAEISLSEFHSEGIALRDAYVRANESYEALMTSPRKDLGDNIQKAFANVDDIVKDLGLELTEENRRAVRILGYNRMEMSVENVQKVSAADAEVNDVIRKMTPAATMKMIREGVNPLEKSFEELNTYLDNSAKEYEEQAESYSRFLYKMEHNKEISQDERDAYIGIFRMIRQIEKSDGAAVGALVNSQAQLQFANLLSAVRSGKFKHLDVKVEDAFGGIVDVVRKGESISDQIAKGFVKDVDEIMTEVSYLEEAEAEYYRERLEEVREASNVTPAAAELLKKGMIVPNAGYLIAAEELLNGEENLFRKISKREKELGKDGESRLDKASKELADNLDNESFDADYDEAIDNLKEEVEWFSISSDTEIDVRDMKLAHKQLNIAASASHNEEYFIPMYMGDELTQVHLTVERATEEGGQVSISVNMAENHSLKADFRLSGNVLAGIFVGSTNEEVSKLKDAADIISDRISKGEGGLDGILVREISTFSSEEYTGSRVGKDADTIMTDGAENIQLYRIAKMFLQAVR